MKIVNRILQAFAHRIYSSRAIAQYIFELKFQPMKSAYYYFDITTYTILKKVIPRLTKSNVVLDLGTGPHAVVGLSTWKRIGCKVISVDINPNLASFARQTIQLNSAPIEVVESDLFTNVRDRFDTVIFNAPYVPTGDGESWNLSKETQTQWDGGADGTEVIQKLFRALANYKDPVTCFMGINGLLVPQKAVYSLLKNFPGLHCPEIIKIGMLPTDVYVIKNQ